MIKTDLNIRQSYKGYKKNNVKLEEYIDICNNFNKFIMSKVIKGAEVILPSELGTFSVLGSKHPITFNDKGEPNLAPNWVKTKELWERCEGCKEKKQLVYHTNEHSSGIRYKMVWSKKNMIITNKALYSFRLTRQNKRDISKEINNGKEYYVKFK